MIRLLSILIAIGATLLAALYLLGSGSIGSSLVSGPVAPGPVPAATIEQKDRAQASTIARIQQNTERQVLFGDLHVHSTISTDAFQMSMTMYGGDGARPVSDACDFARYCSALDFWSINDHALAITPDRWQETRNAINACNAAAGSQENPDMVSYLGWEWTQIGRTADDHYGHKNVIIKTADMKAAPIRPISAGFPPGASPEDVSTLALGLLPLVMGFNADTHNYITYMQGMMQTPDCVGQEGEIDCRAVARTPGELFTALNDWGGDSLVIPHGTTWGYYTPLGSSWKKQLSAEQHDPHRQTLIEVFSGHGNSEEYRSWREVDWAVDGSAVCPPRAANYLPSCQRAGDIIEARCLAQKENGRSECSQRARDARQHYVDGNLEGFLTVPGAAPEDWLDSGQCRDCFLPSFNYRPLSSVQYMMALSNFDGPSPQRFRFGFMASSDVHSARPGTGYKEFARDAMTESRFGNFINNPLDQKIISAPEARSIPFDRSAHTRGFASLKETERQASYFMTGGLIAVHADSRSREHIWAAMERKEVYGTSGPRMLLWFDLLNAPDARKLPMGSETAMAKAPIFEVTAVGSLEQNPGCPEHSNSALGSDRIADLCRGECYHPSDRRRAITRIEVIRIQPQASPDEPVDELIEDPWKVIPCVGDAAGCTVSFSDEDFNAQQRDTLYYVRAIESASVAVNGGGVRCSGNGARDCKAVKLCDITDPTNDCLADVEERAWSSPIFIDYQYRATAVTADSGKSGH